MYTLLARRAFNLVTVVLIISEITMATVSIEKIEHLSSKRAFFSTAQAGQKIFFIGGFEFNDFIASKTIDVYNLASGSWEPSVNLTTARGRISSIVLGPRIYMAGGQAYTNEPCQFSWQNRTFLYFTSGPTVRRPVRLALHNNTLTAIGYFSVDFMDTNTKIWTHNEKLTSVMSTLFDTTTVAHNNFVLVIGGTNGTNQLPSLSAWVVDTPTSNPIEFKNITTSPASTKQFIGSWFDEAHEAVVIQFSNQCLVFHTDSQTWLQRDTINNNSVSFVSYQNSTIVFFSDGYWTIDWHLMNDTWTSHDQITFAFSIADQFVFGNEEQMSIVTPESTLTQPIELGTPALSIAASSSSYIIVNSSCAFFAYNSDTKQLVLLNYPLKSKPVNIFRDNNSRVYIISEIDSRFGISTLNATAFLGSSLAAWNPDALIHNYFVQVQSGQLVTAEAPTTIIPTYGRAQPFSIWAKQGDEIYLMRTAPLSSPPINTIPYAAVDVYNYVENKWESSIPTPFFLYAHSYMYTFILGNSLHVASRPNLYRLNETENWVRSVGYPVIYSQSHATYSPPPVMDDAVYLMDNGAGLFIISIDMAIQRVKSSSAGVAQQAVATNRAILLSIVSSTPYYSTVVFYDILSDRWQGTIFQTNDVMVSIIPYDDWVLSFGDNSTYFSYLDLSSIGWGTEPFDNSFVPASLFTLSTLSNRTTLVIAGGYHRIGWYYTDQVRFVTLDLAPVIVPVASQQPSSPSTTPQEPDNNDLTTIVVATVIPIVVVVVVAVFLTIFLLRRKERRRKQSAVTMIGLEQRFGEWFTPFNDIQFGEQLGRGASGQVFKGKRKNTDVALKVSMTQANQSVIAELSLMINLRPHPNVMQLYGFSVHPETNSIILILEFCNGGSLDSLLYYDNAPGITIIKQLHWLKCICKGISHLHSNNIVHRDLAARNVLLNQGEPKITDFGMSRVVDEQQRGTTKSELGPIRWMAPESLRDKQYSNKSGMLNESVLLPSC
jgi:hypothetical protein